MHKTEYPIIDKTDSKKLTEFLCKEGQLLLPLVELITHTQMALDELIDLTGRAAIEAVLTLSAQEVAGARHPGKKAGDIRWYGRRSTTVPLSNRKLRNVLGYLPDEREADVEAAMKAAFKLKAEEGMAKLEKLAQWLDREYPSAAGSLREGLAELFTINRLGIPKTLRRCLGSTNVIESPYSGVREKTGRVKRWRDGQMVLRWTASAMLSIEKRLRRIIGCRQLWMLDASLKDLNEKEDIVVKDKVA